MFIGFLISFPILMATLVVAEIRRDSSNIPQSEESFCISRGLKPDCVSKEKGIN